MIEDMQVRNLAPHTQSTYLKEITRFARYFGKSPEPLGEKEIRTYQLYLTNQKKLAPSSIVITIAALRFLYVRARTLRRCPPAVHNSCKPCSGDLRGMPRDKRFSAQGPYQGEQYEDDAGRPASRWVVLAAGGAGTGFAAGQLSGKLWEHLSAR
jgi:hypothetical protein